MVDCHPVEGIAPVFLQPPLEVDLPDPGAGVDEEHLPPAVDDDPRPGVGEGGRGREQERPEAEAEESCGVNGCCVHRCVLRAGDGDRLWSVVMGYESPMSGSSQKPFSRSDARGPTEISPEWANGSKRVRSGMIIRLCDGMRVLWSGDASGRPPSFCGVL